MLKSHSKETRKFTLLLICLLFSIIPFYGQESEKLFNFKDITNSSHNVNYGDDNNFIIQAGIISASTAALFLFDNKIRKKNTTKNSGYLLDIGHTYGDAYYNFGLAGALYLSHFIFRDKKIVNTGKILFESLAIGSLASISLKFIFGRSRPYKDEGVLKFNWFETKNIKNSLPSGHVITAFTTSTVLAESINNNYITIFLYGIASLTAYQRIITDNHWFSDVFLGAAIGVISGKYFSYLGNKNNDSSNSINLIPFFDRTNPGIALLYTF